MTTYTMGVTPVDYECAKCQVTGCKLWREYQTFVIHLLCASCACQAENKVDDVDENGKRSSQFGDRTDQIGWYVPAVPVLEGGAYWGYTTVPDDGVAWWESLPTRSKSVN